MSSTPEVDHGEVEFSFCPSLQRTQRPRRDYRRRSLTRVAGAAWARRNSAAKTASCQGSSGFWKHTLARKASRRARRSTSAVSRPPARRPSCRSGSPRRPARIVGMNGAPSTGAARLRSSWPRPARARAGPGACPGAAASAPNARRADAELAAGRSSWQSRARRNSSSRSSATNSRSSAATPMGGAPRSSTRPS
jgi:hypothetical protein